MDLLSFFIIVITLLAFLWSVTLFLLWRRLHKAQQEIQQINTQHHVFVSSSISVGQRLEALERSLSKSKGKAAELERNDADQQGLYHQAAKLAALGVDKAELIKGFDLTETEADLLQVMAGKKQAR